MSDFIEVLNTAVENGPETLGTGMGLLGLKRIIGPSVDAIGSALGDFTDYRVRNWLSIGAKAERIHEQSGDEEDEESFVHPRVVQAALVEGSWVDDDLHQSYLAGLLVSARSKDGKSDSLSYLTQTVARMTATQIRLHYAVYRGYAGYWPDDAVECPFPWDDKNKYRQHALIVSQESAEQILAGDRGAALALLREDLISDFGTTAELRAAKETSFVPSNFGGLVYLAALGAPAANHKLICLSDDRLERIRRAYPERQISKLVHPEGPAELLDFRRYAPI